MKQENEFVLPEKWCVKNYPETLNWIRKNAEFNGEYITEGNFFYMPNDSYSSNFSDSYPNGYTEITRDEFKQHVLKEPNDVYFNSEFNSESKIVGYKLINEDYKEAVKAIINQENWFRNFDINLKEKGFNFAYMDEKDPCFWMSIHSEIKKSGVLHLWFEPVFEEKKIKLTSGIELTEKDIEEVKEILKNK